MAGIEFLTAVGQACTLTRQEFILLSAEGRYELVTARPVEYQVPTDGTVGALLKAKGRHAWRAAHIHAIVSAAGYRRVVTHLFDADRGYLDSDAVFGVKPSLVRTFTPHRAADGSVVFTLEYDFVLEPDDR